MSRKTRLRWLLGTAAALTGARLAGAALAPTLLGYSPLLLIALSPLAHHVVLAATVAPMLPVVAVTTLRRLLSGLLGYAVGNLFGDGGIVWVRTRYPAFSGFFDVLERLFAAAGPLVIVIIPPDPLIGALAGATRMPLWLFVLAGMAGHAMWATLTYRVGEALSAQIAPIMHFMKDHKLETTLVCIAIVLGYAWLRRARRNGGGSDFAALPPDPDALKARAESHEG